MQIHYALPKWQPKGPLPPKIDQKANRLFLYQERKANTNKTFRWGEAFQVRSKMIKSAP